MSILVSPPHNFYGLVLPSLSPLLSAYPITTKGWTPPIVRLHGDRRLSTLPPPILSSSTYRNDVIVRKSVSLIKRYALQESIVVFLELCSFLAGQIFVRSERSSEFRYIEHTVIVRFSAYRPYFRHESTTLPLLFSLFGERKGRSQPFHPWLFPLVSFALTRLSSCTGPRIYAGFRLEKITQIFLGQQSCCCVVGMDRPNALAIHAGLQSMKRISKTFPCVRGPNWLNKRAHISNLRASRVEGWKNVADVVDESNQLANGIALLCAFSFLTGQYVPSWKKETD